MNYYNKIPIWEHKKRVNTLIGFRDLVITYYNNATREYLEPGLRENDTARQTRSKINLLVNKVSRILYATGIDASVYYTPPPALGGLTGNIDLPSNIFNLHRYGISHQILIDYIERALGVYEDDYKNCLIRTFNPFFWIGLLLSYIAKIPFMILGKLGFHQSKMESSFLGRLIKGIIYIITVIASIITILELTGHLESYKPFFRDLFQS